MKVAWIIYVIFAGAVGASGFISYMQASGAEQKCAEALFALAGVGIPYLFLAGISQMKAIDAATAAAGHAAFLEDRAREAAKEAARPMVISEEFRQNLSRG